MKSTCSLAGIDVSKAKLDAQALIRGAERSAQFSNDDEGHRAFLKWIGSKARVCVEATGGYHLQFCLALRRTGIEVMVVNPRQARDFARALAVRSKNDRVDAAVLLEYLGRMPFIPWNAPSKELLELRELTRRMRDLVQSGADEKKRKHAYCAAGVSRTIINDVEVNIRHLTKRIARLEREAVALVANDSVLASKYDSVRFIGTRTALYLMAELLPLDPEMTTRQITAYAGLDPREYESGTSVKKPPRISRVGNAHVRAALYLPALTIMRSNELARHYVSRLVARGKKKMQAIVALMRKLLHAVWTLMQCGGSFDPRRLFPLDSAALDRIGRSNAMAESPDSAMTAPQPKAKASHPKGRSEAEERQLDSSQTEARCSLKRHAAA